MTPRLHTELWTSWASLLRSYAAAHGLNSTHNATVEVSADQITIRIATHWLHFTSTACEHDDGHSVPFAIHEDGTVSLADASPEEMDFAAERLTRELFAIAS